MYHLTAYNKCGFQQGYKFKTQYNLLITLYLKLRFLSLSHQAFFLPGQAPSQVRPFPSLAAKRME